MGMSRFEEQPKFTPQPAVERKPFEPDSVQSFFKLWCEINGSMVPKIVSRGEWNSKGKKILEDAGDGEYILYIPEDLQLWEMLPIIEAIDKDTFTHKPERQTEKKEEISELGRDFCNTGIYIAQRLDAIEEGKDIASALAKEFYTYGESILTGEKSEGEISIPMLQNKKLSTKDLTKADRFLAGDQLYASRESKAKQAAEGGDERAYENMREKTLAQLFRIAQRALELQERTEVDASRSFFGDFFDRLKTGKKKPPRLGKSKNLDLLDDIPVHSAFLTKLDRNIKRKIDLPEQELMKAVFRRGIEIVADGMKEPKNWRHTVNTFFKTLGIDIGAERKTLADTLRISELKTELDSIRKTGDRKTIGQKEREITDKIQRAVCSLALEDFTNFPIAMVARQTINCVGASLLGGALLSEVGINYLVGDVPRHSILFLVTSDGEVEWRDMLFEPNNERITNDMLVDSEGKSDQPLTVKDIVMYAGETQSEGLNFYIEENKFREKVPWADPLFDEFNEDRKGDEFEPPIETSNCVHVLSPKVGEQVEVLQNMALLLGMFGRRAEAFLALRSAIALDPKAPALYTTLATVLEGNRDYEEAARVLQQAIALDPKSAYSYYQLGRVFKILNRNKEAARAYRLYISLGALDHVPEQKRKMEYLIAKLDK